MNFRLQPQKLQLSENDVEEQCVTLLGLHGYKVIRLQSGKFKTFDDRWITVGEPGLPDYVAIHERHPGFFLEVKRPGKKPSPVQELKHRELRVRRLAVTTADSVKGLLAWLEKHGQSP